MTNSGSVREPDWGLFREEVLRWNRQINLISRVRTEQRLTSLIDQSRWAVEALKAALREKVDTAAEIPIEWVITSQTGSVNDS